jgi:hypothetical protein
MHSIIENFIYIYYFYVIDQQFTNVIHATWTTKMKARQGEDVHTVSASFTAHHHVACPTCPQAAPAGWPSKAFNNTLTSTDVVRAAVTSGKSNKRLMFLSSTCYHLI